MALNPLTDPAEALKRLIPPRSELSHLTARFVDGDHFQDGAGWIGDLPSEPAARMQHLTMLRHAFIASNQIAKVLSRHQAGVMGRPPRWAIQMGSASLAQADAEAVTTWWQQAGIHAMLQQATALLLRDRRVVLRLAIPPLPEDRPAPQTLAEALRLIALVPVAGDAGTVLRDAWEHVQYGVVLGVDTDDQAWTEVTTRQGLHTALRVIRHDADQTVWYPLGGRLLHHMLERPVFVTPQMVRLQQALNLDLTQLVRNINLAGSRERYFLNAKPPATISPRPPMIRWGCSCRRVTRRCTSALCRVPWRWGPEWSISCRAVRCWIRTATRWGWPIPISTLPIPPRWTASS